MEPIKIAGSKKSSHVVRFLRACVYAAVAYLIFEQLSVGSGILSGTIAGFSSAWVGEYLAFKKIRLWIILTSGIFLALLGYFLGSLLVASETMAGILSIRGVIALSDFIRFGFISLSLFTLMRVLALRYPPLASLEILLIAGVVVQLLGVHRDGNIHEPRDLADKAWSTGGEPTIILFKIGALLFIGVIIAVLNETHWKRAIYHVIVVIIIAYAGYEIMREFQRPPEVNVTEDLGLTGKPKHDGVLAMNQGQKKDKKSSGMFKKTKEKDGFVDDSQVGDKEENRKDNQGGANDGTQVAQADKEGKGPSGTKGEKTEDKDGEGAEKRQKRKEDDTYGGATEGSMVEQKDQQGRQQGQQQGKQEGDEQTGQQQGQQQGKQEGDEQTGQQQEQQQGKQEGDEQTGQGGDQQRNQQTGQEGDQQEKQVDQKDQHGQEKQKRSQGDNSAQNTTSEPPDPEDLNIKDQYESEGEDKPVAVVIFRDEYTPPNGYYYFRQTAFSQFNGRRLVKATRDDVDDDLIFEFPSDTIKVPSSPGLGQYRVKVPTTVALLTEHIRPFALEAPVDATARPNPDPRYFLVAYDVTSYALNIPFKDMVGKTAMTEHWTEAQRKHYTALPDDPRYKALALKIISELKENYRKDPVLQALAIKRYLDTHGYYSKKSEHSSAADPTASFLFGDMRGYCVLFAHAAVFLLRSLGIPARVGAGYTIPEGNRGGGSGLLIYGKYAHAWPEIFIDDMGWVIVDIMPQQSDEKPGTPPDMELQKAMSELARGDKSAGTEEKAMDEPEGDSTGMMLRMMLQALIAALLIGAYTIKLWRRIAPKLCRKKSRYRLSYRATLDRLSEVGFTRQFGESRETFAKRVEVFSPSFPGLTAAHISNAFGSGKAPPASGVAFLETKVSHEVGQNARWWRRVLGLANPLSWMFSR